MSVIAERNVLPSATQRIADFICFTKVPASVRTQAAHAFVDTMAATLAGGAEPGVRVLESALCDDHGNRSVPSFWTGRKYRAEEMALLVGMASHVLDYDDVSMLAVCHPSAPVLSAIVSGAPVDLSGADALGALAIGTEVMIRLGQAAGFRHYAIGFHATATLGTVGAAAACARLWRLDADKTAHAISIAASSASGLRKNFGSMVKSLHVGMAASNGMRAARLAASGIAGAPDAIEGEGFLQAFSGAETDHWPEHLVLGAPFAIEDPGFEQKRYPCCYMLHKIIEATLGLRRENGLALDQVAAMRVDMAPGATKPLIHPFPRAGLNALFSAPYAVAAALEDGRIDFKSFTDSSVLREKIQKRLRDVTVVESQAQAQSATDIGSAPVKVTVTLEGGRTLSKSVVVSPGSRQDPLTDADLSVKWLDCLRRAQPDLPEATAKSLLQQGFSIGSAPAMSLWLDGLRKAMVAQ